jgi:hypothetical protein
MNILLGLTKVVIAVPFVGPMVQKYLPTDKPWFQSATVWAGIAWAASAIVAGADINGIDHHADKIAAGFNIAGPVLMLLGVRKASTGNGTTPTK